MEAVLFKLTSSQQIKIHHTWTSKTF